MEQNETGMPIKVFTLGTSTRSLEEFFSVLGHYGIAQLLDVRRFPKSRKFSHFNMDILSAAAAEKGISYYWLGETLGGFRKGGYKAYQETDSYLRGIERVEALAKQRVSALVCAERLPWKCHRLKISKTLEVRGWSVVHIIDSGRTWVRTRSSPDRTEE